MFSRFFLTLLEVAQYGFLAARRMGTKNGASFNLASPYSDDARAIEVKKYKLPLISEVTVVQQILALVCYISVALIWKIPKRTRMFTSDLWH